MRSEIEALAEIPDQPEALLRSLGSPGDVVLQQRGEGSGVETPKGDNDRFDNLQCEFDALARMLRPVKS